MEIIKSRNNISWNVIGREVLKTGKGSKSFYIVKCSKCGHRKTGQKANLKILASCPGCSDKPAALKTDTTGNCVTICRMGQLEFIHKLITEESMTQKGAVETFIEAVQAHSNEGDPLTSDLTVEMVRSQYRRDSGKLKEKTKEPLVEPTNEVNSQLVENSTIPPKQEQKHNCLATVEGVQQFLNKYLPGYKIVMEEGL